jgi:hypothetical protein
VPLTGLQEALRRIARKRIAAGQLPHEAPSRMWGGSGTDQPCALCDMPISSDEIEYEIEIASGSAVRTFVFHMVCQSVWQLECAHADYLRKNP